MTDVKKMREEAMKVVLTMWIELEKSLLTDEAWWAVCDCINTFYSFLPAEDD